MMEVHEMQRRPQNPSESEKKDAHANIARALW